MACEMHAGKLQLGRKAAGQEGEQAFWVGVEGNSEACRHEGGSAPPAPAHVRLLEPLENLCGR